MVEMTSFRDGAAGAPAEHVILVERGRSGAAGRPAAAMCARASPARGATRRRAGAGRPDRRSRAPAASACQSCRPSPPPAPTRSSGRSTAASCCRPVGIISLTIVRDGSASKNDSRCGGCRARGAESCVTPQQRRFPDGVPPTRPGARRRSRRRGTTRRARAGSTRRSRCRMNTTVGFRVERYRLREQFGHVPRRAPPRARPTSRSRRADGGRLRRGRGDRRQRRGSTAGSPLTATSRPSTRTRTRSTKTPADTSRGSPGSARRPSRKAVDDARRWHEARARPLGAAARRRERPDGAARSRRPCPRPKQRPAGRTSAAPAASAAHVRRRR